MPGDWNPWNPLNYLCCLILPMGTLDVGPLARTSERNAGAKKSHELIITDKITIAHAEGLVSFVDGYPGISNEAVHPKATMQGTITLSGFLRWRMESLCIELWCNDELVLRQYLNLNGQTEGSMYISVDTFSVPFKVMLPDNLPPTCSVARSILRGVDSEVEPSIDPGAARYSGISYFIMARAQFKRSKRVGATLDMASALYGMTVERYDLHAAWPAYSRPASCATRGNGVLLEVQTDRQCYGPEDAISVTATLQSESASTLRVEVVEAKLVSMSWGRMGGDIIKMQGPANVSIKGGADHTVNMELAVPMTDPPLMTVDRSALRNVQYKLFFVVVTCALESGIKLETMVEILISPWRRTESEAIVRQIGPEAVHGLTYDADRCMITTGRPLHNSWKSYVDSSPTSRYTPSPPRSMSPAVGGLRSNPSTDSLASSISVPVCRTGRPPLGAAFVGSGASKQNVVDIQASKRDCECLLTIISWSLESAGGICSVDHKSSLHSLLEAYLTQRANRVEQTWPHSQPDVSALLSLSRADACCLMDIIDEALKIEIGSPHRCMRLLRRLCSQSECLPSSHMLHGDLVKLGDGAVATGGSADVWLGRFGSQRVAMKVLRIHVDRVQKIASKFCEEASLWKRLSHRNILVYHGVAPPNLFPLCMVSEWHPFRNVLDYVCEHPEANRPGLIRDVANGLQYLHEKGIVHADLKSANVLVKADHHACLADFGLAAVTHDPTTSTSFATSISTYGTWRYMAPELLQASVKSTFKSDMYSFAMVILEIFSNSIPFPNMQDGPVVTEVSIRGNRPPRPTQATQLGLSDGVWLTMQRYWDADPAARPGVQEVVNVMKVDGSLHDCECPSCVEP